MFNEAEKKLVVSETLLGLSSITVSSTKSFIDATIAIPIASSSVLIILIAILNATEDLSE